MPENNDEDEDTEKKKLTFWLVYNWKTEDIKRYKREPKPKKIGPYDIKHKMNVTLQIPDPEKEYESNVKINVPEPKVKEMVAEEL